MKKVLMTVVMLGMSGGMYAAEFSELAGVKAADLKASAASGSFAVPSVSKGYVAGNDPSAGVPTKPVEWVAINGGKFTMGTDSG